MASELEWELRLLGLLMPWLFFAHYRVQGRFLEVVQRVQDHAMALTQQMAAQQARERSSLVEHIKQTMAQQVQLKKNWQDIVHSLTHER